MRIDGRAWRIVFARIRDFGDCQYGACRRTRRIRISPDQSDEDLLDTLVHEILHAQDWALSEEAVTQRATEIAAAVLRVFELERRAE